MSPTRPTECPHCGSPKLTFAEQLPAVTVYLCADCGRAVSVPHAPAGSRTSSKDQICE
jgi:DNA-directed RNA polymerase subunit RPC12/RpoP